MLEGGGVDARTLLEGGGVDARTLLLSTLKLGRFSAGGFVAITGGGLVASAGGGGLVATTGGLGLTTGV